MSANEGNATKYSGIDYNQLVTLADALNFTFHVLPSNNWAEVSEVDHRSLGQLKTQNTRLRHEVPPLVGGDSCNGLTFLISDIAFYLAPQVTDQVEARKSFLASIVYVVLPSRLERWDYTYSFDYTPFCFALAKPVLRPSWLSCYYPLSHQVWIGIFISALVVCGTLVQITGSDMWMSQYGQLSTGAVIMEVLGSLLGQGLYGRLSTRRSNHMLVATWMIFGVVVGAGYRGSLIASLTLPRQPPRPETVEELVTAVER
ncbi:hypothetical protein Pmani_002213 [Petrolisthes manimaculis]|uniref:Uncharacterized protein n=2 Tax=Petrolisthes manimaculis TaxID=1843537 RepID=A0AAE1UKK7_9EUCA|nr:hypothetical protein Pmani_009018 [Petrolisthes manimaculis]KAK4327272.1 hypothetical protein Pmani_002213 [Petrolisthes manimaculis]